MGELVLSEQSSAGICEAPALPGQADLVGTVAGRTGRYLVLRQWRPMLTSATPLPIEFESLSEPPECAIAFSEDGLSVTLACEDLSFSGELSASSPGTYDLDAFAGGAFEVWTHSSGPRAALVLYGSGLPLVDASSGQLVLDPLP